MDDEQIESPNIVDRGTGRPKTTRAVAVGIKIRACPVSWDGPRSTIAHRIW
jgi:hypothetical protein